MASPGAKRRAEDRASVEYLVEQYPEWFLEEGWDGEQSEKRRRQPTPDYSTSVWGKMLLDPALDGPTSIVAITFRRRFRVPYPLFKFVGSAFRIHLLVWLRAWVTGDCIGCLPTWLVWFASRAWLLDSVVSCLRV